MEVGDIGCRILAILLIGLAVVLAGKPKQKHVTQVVSSSVLTLDKSCQKSVNQCQPRLW